MLGDGKGSERGAVAACPACEAGRLEVFCEIRAVPVFCNVLWPTQQEARRAPRSDLRLGFCAACGLVYNVAFDPTLVAYSPAYENSQHFSPHFHRYAEDLARRLVTRHGLERREVVEIGCGKGEFLALLRAAGMGRATGFDASYDPARLGPAAAGIEVRREPFGEAHADAGADLICCRHVLEHIDRPLPFLRLVRRAAAERPGAVVFVEVPNALYTLEDLGIWDLIYEHCSYFAPITLARLFAHAGLRPLQVWTTYHNQFLCVEGCVAPEGSAPGSDAQGPFAPGPSVEGLATLVRSFARHLADKIAEWRTRLAALASNGRRVAVWGAGSKGVTFLNVLPEASALAAVIDINPQKQGRHVAGTGQRIFSPESLRDARIDTVLVMNPVYREEIAQRLTGLGVAAEVLAV